MHLHVGLSVRLSSGQRDEQAFGTNRYTITNACSCQGLGEEKSNRCLPHHRTAATVGIRTGVWSRSLNFPLSVTARPIQEATMSTDTLTERQREILECIETAMRDRGYPPSVREIGEAVGLSSSSTVHAHLSTLQRLGFLRRDPSKPRAIEVRYDPHTGSNAERRPVRHVPLIGEVAAGTGVLSEERVEEVFPLPQDFTGDGNLFMLKVRGDSMIEAGILSGDYVVVRQQDVRNGDIVVVGIPGEEATVKEYKRKGSHITLLPHNAKLSPMTFDADEVTMYGKVVTVMRRL